MIKLDRCDEPQVLKDYGAIWLKDLQDAIASYGSYKNIPELEKSKLVGNYRHDEIKKSLSVTSFGKCAFCECHPAEGGYIQVEHFKPKAIYPEFTFEWENFLPACAQCNGSKSDHDTLVEPIINPYDTDPEVAFYFDGISIKPRNGPYQDMARRTIEVCSLESIRLWKPRADILVSLMIFTEAVVEATKELDQADTERKKTMRRRKLNEALLIIESLTHPASKYSAFCKSYLRNCEEYLKAKRLATT